MEKKVAVNNFSLPHKKIIMVDVDNLKAKKYAKPNYSDEYFGLSGKRNCTGNCVAYALI
jgi:hypothetical protein